MEFLGRSWFVDFSIVILPLLLALYTYLTWNNNYWKDRHVLYAKPVLGFGSMFELLKGKSHAEIVEDIYKQFPGERFCGLFQFRKPRLIIRDPKLIEQILIKDFSHFEDRPLPIDPENDPLSVHLVNLKGKKWRNLRYKLTPTFTSGKLKGMFEQMCNSGDNLLKIIDRHSRANETVETKSLISKFSTDTIASCAFGLQIDAEGSEGKLFLKMVNKVTSGGSRFGALRMRLIISFPELAKFFKIKSVPSDAEEYFLALSKATIDHRTNENIKREDFLQMLLSLKEQEEDGKLEKGSDREVIDQEDIQLKYKVKPDLSGDDDLKFTDKVIAAQSFVFLAAGAETVSSTISTALYYIAENPEVQSKLQAEVDTMLAEHGSYTYSALKAMTYMDEVIQEAQRMFPISHIHPRTCTAPYKVPGSDLVIEKGDVVFIPVHALQTDPAHYPNPETFKPERFRGNNFKPSSIYSPFGDGPRMCIAMRFAVLEMKVCIAKILSQFCVKSSPKTISPLRYDPNTFILRALGGIWLTFQRRTS